MLVTSGLRSAELVQLRWKGLERFEGTRTARFIGKGNREAEQQLYTEAVEACRQYFQTQFKRENRSPTTHYSGPSRHTEGTSLDRCYITLHGGESRKSARQPGSKGLLPESCAGAGTCSAGLTQRLCTSPGWGSRRSRRRRDIRILTCWYGTTYTTMNQPAPTLRRCSDKLNGYYGYIRVSMEE
jgi:hypothetical protein